MCAVLTELTDAAHALAPPSGVPAADSKAMTEQSEEASLTNEHPRSELRQALPRRTRPRLHPPGLRPGRTRRRRYRLLDGRLRHRSRGPCSALCRLEVHQRQAVRPVASARCEGAGQEDRCQRTRWCHCERLDLKLVIRPGRQGGPGIAEEAHPQHCADDRIFGPGEGGVGDLLWWYLSGATHSAAYALMQSVQMHEEATAKYGGGETMAAILTSAGTVQMIGLTLARAYVTTVNEHRRLMGWGSERWN